MSKRFIQYGFTYDARMLGPATALNPFYANTSASRLQMLKSQAEQALAVNGATHRCVSTGVDYDLANYTYSVKTDTDLRVINIVGLTHDTPEIRGTKLVIYQCMVTGSYGIIELPYFCKNHQYFGFKYKETEAFKNLKVGGYLAKDTILLNSPDVIDNAYCNGIQANVVWGSFPGTTEDAIVISDQFADNASFYIFEERVIQYGTEYILLNTYGDTSNYRCYPNIGEKVRPDGVLCALRKKPSDLLVGSFNGINSSRVIDRVTDDIIHVMTDSIVVDIKVHHNINQGDASPKETNSNWQTQEIDRLKRFAYNEILNWYRMECAKNGGSIGLTPVFNNYLKDIIAYLHKPAPSEGAIKYYYKTEPLDTNRVCITTCRLIRPDKGYKFTDMHGGKGTVSMVVPKEDMPKDIEGNVADILFAPIGTINRTNIGRLFESRVSEMSRNLVTDIRTTLGLSDKDKPYKVQETLMRTSDDMIRNIFYRICTFVKICDEELENIDVSNIHVDEMRKDIQMCLKMGFVKVLKRECSDKTGEQIVTELSKAGFRVVKSVLTYKNLMGDFVTTKDTFSVGSLYIMTLGKIGHERSSISFTNQNSFGFPASQNKNSKHRKPTSRQPVKVYGETEIRILLSYAYTDWVCRTIEMNNSPVMQYKMATNILLANQPTNMERIIPRNDYIYGNSRPHQILNQIMATFGETFAYERAVDANWSILKR